MSRVDENARMIDSVSKIRFTTGESAANIAVLKDISKSLAIMADVCLDDWQKMNVNSMAEVDDGK